MWLDFEAQLIARLQANLDATISIVAARDLTGAKEALQIAPAVQIYGGEYRVHENSRDGRVAMVEQSWICLVLVRNATDQTTGKAARSDAGPICDAVLAALLGWPATDPADARLRLVNAPTAPMWSAGGYGYYPLAFSRRMTASGTPS